MNSMAVHGRAVAFVDVYPEQYVVSLAAVRLTLAESEKPDHDAAHDEVHGG